MEKEKETLEQIVYQLKMENENLRNGINNQNKESNDGLNKMQVLFNEAEKENEKLRKEI